MGTTRSATFAPSHCRAAAEPGRKEDFLIPFDGYRVLNTLEYFFLFLVVKTIQEWIHQMKVFICKLKPF